MDIFSIPFLFYLSKKSRSNTYYWPTDWLTSLLFSDLVTTGSAVGTNSRVLAKVMILFTVGQNFLLFFGSKKYHKARCTTGLATFCSSWCHCIKKGKKDLKTSFLRHSFPIYVNLVALNSIANCYNLLLLLLWIHLQLVIFLKVRFYATKSVICNYELQFGAMTQWKLG